MVTQPSGKRLLQKEHVLHNALRARSVKVDSWLQSLYKHNYSLAQQMCLLVMTQVLSLFDCLYRWNVVKNPGITTVIVQRLTPPKTLSHWSVGVVLLTHTPWMYQMTLSADSRHIHTQASYPAPSWPCTGPQHLHWNWSFRWLSRFLCWPATWKNWIKDYSSAEQILGQLMLSLNTEPFFCV